VTLFAVTIRTLGQKGIGKEIVNIFKVNLMLGKIVQTLALVPFEYFELHFFVKADAVAIRSPDHDYLNAALRRDLPKFPAWMPQSLSSPNPSILRPVALVAISRRIHNCIYNRSLLASSLL
jgi:hypothetical protein